MAIVVADNSNPEMPSVMATHSGSGGQHMHKNCLQEYAQRSGVPLPSYSSFNEGEPHAPRFRASVVIDGMVITSPNTFSHRKESEQDVARLALEQISLKFKNEGSHNIHKDPVFCKLILNEYGAKLKIDKATYNTTEQKGILQTFVTTITFNGKTYVGFVGKSKKAAEQNAACVVIDSILADSNRANVMAQIIKTKDRFYAAVYGGANAGNVAKRSGNETDGVNNVNRESGPVVIPTNGSLPVRSTSWVPSNSMVDTVDRCQVNYQITSLGLPTEIYDSQAIISKKRNKRPKKKKRRGGQFKRVKFDEQLQGNPRFANFKKKEKQFSD